MDDSKPGYSFSIEQTNIFCLCQHDTREHLIADLRAFIPDTYDQHTAWTIQKAVSQLEKMTDSEYLENVYIPAETMM